ncbi:MAG: 4-(cytidine 5'-diphospho)-2-C-methyl-D-erythritol kinase [Bacteroidia bacterium]|nr:4-(cytidine 5'-diphospho)-2-C-methyl-D-erythritol kinase [Bacteroidia bacterium]
MTETLSLFPNAKINLGLFIKGKRADGYHLLETLLFPVTSLSDTLSLSPINQAGCTLSVSGIALDSGVQDNLCYKAWKLMVERFPDLPGVHIDLQKNIPAGAGLGGGSSDAAFTLKGLNQLFSLGLSDPSLAEIAAKLGADVPFFIYNQPLLARGIGTDLTAVDLPLPGRLEVVTPNIHSSTVAAYKSLDYRMFDPERDLLSVLKLPVNQWREFLVNDLEVPVFAMYPQLKEIKENFYQRGAIYAAMSGSGSAVFGLFPL